MAFITGFYNSINKDRLYTAEDMNYPYKKIVSNGVFAEPYSSSSTDLQVLAYQGLNIKVCKGNGIFKDKWAELTDEMILSLATAHTLLNRYDSVIVRIDETETVRAGKIYIKNGDYAESPTPPSLESSDTVKEYRLANILVNANVEQITQDDIEDTRPSADCGWVTNLLWKSDISATYKQWEAQFTTWFNKIKQQAASLTGDINFFKSYYKTTEDDEKIININIEEYDQNFDLLQVVVSGLILAEGVDYAIAEDNLTVTLTYALDKGTEVQFYVWHKQKKEE